MGSILSYCSDCGRRLAPGSRQGCCLNPDRATGQLRRAEVIGALCLRGLDRAERLLISTLLTQFAGQAGEAELTHVLRCSSEFLYEVAAPRGRHAARMSSCLNEDDRFRVTDQARDAWDNDPTATETRSATAAVGRALRHTPPRLPQSAAP